MTKQNTKHGGVLFARRPLKLTGQISMCGKSHAGMGEMGKNPKEYTVGCVKAGAKYVLVTGDDLRGQEPELCGPASQC